MCEYCDKYILIITKKIDYSLEVLPVCSFKFGLNIYFSKLRAKWYERKL